MKKSNGNKLLTSLMIICTLLSIAILGIVSYDKFFRKKEEPVCNCQTPNNIEEPKKEKKITIKKGDEDYILDFDDLETRLLNSSNIVKLVTCDCTDIDYDNIETMKCSNKELSKESIKKVMDKLYNAKKVVWAPTGRVCVEYEYAVGDFFMFEADDKSIILASIDEDGYAFYYDNEDVRDFLRDLT